MALIEALEQLVGAAMLAAAPACDVQVLPAAAQRYSALPQWLKANGSDKPLLVVSDALGREIWVAAETRDLAQPIVEQHALALARLIVATPPPLPLLAQALERGRAGGAAAAGTIDSIARRLAVDIFGRARGGITAAGLKDDVALLLIDRVYRHLLDDPKLMLGLAPALTDFLGTADGLAPAAASSNVASHSLSAASAARLEAAGGARYLVDLRERFGLAEKATRRLLALLDAQAGRMGLAIVRFEELAQWLADVRAQLQKPSNEDAEVRRLKAKAAAALTEGDFEAAAEALKHVRRELREGRRRIEERLADEVAALRTQMLEEARATARLGELALAARSFTDAADLFSEAALALPTTERDAAWRYNLQRAEALLRQAEAGSDAHALTEAITAYGQAVRVVADGSNQKGLGQASLGLATALVLAGERDAGTAVLKDAITASRKALNLLGRDSEPAGWAQAQLRLARAQALVGERDQSTAALREAAEAYREALKELPTDRFGGEHVSAQMGLGNVLLALEEREPTPTLLKEAAEAFTGALAVIPRGGDTQTWREAQMNLGIALLGVGEQQSGSERLLEAVDAFRLALEVTSRAVVPKTWGLIQLNLGNTFAALADRDRASPARIEEAIAAYTEALAEFRRDAEPLKWAIAQMNLGTALIRLGEHRDKRQLWLQAAGALVPALEVFEEQGAEAYADVTRRNLRRFHESWDALIAGPVKPSTDAGPQAAPARLSRAV